MKLTKHFIITIIFLLQNNILCMEYNRLNAVDTRLMLAAQTQGFGDHVLDLCKTTSAGAQDKVGKTRLHYAIQMIDIESVELLLKEPAEQPLVTIQDKDGETPVHLFFSLTPFSHSGSYDKDQVLKMCSLLLGQSHFDPTVTNNKGETILHCSIKQQCSHETFTQTRPELIAMLIEHHKALLDAANHEGETPLHYVFKPETFGSGGINCRLALVPQLLELGADPNQKNNNGETVLHYAVQHVRPNEENLQLHTDAIRALYARGSQLNCQTDHKETPLHYALKMHINKENANITELRLRLVPLLLALGADPNAPNCLGATPLCTLMSSPHNKQKEVIAADMLELYGANPNMRTKEGFTLLHVAVNTLQPKWVELLLAQRTTDVTLVHQPTLKRAPSLQEEKGRTALDMALAIQQSTLTGHDNDAETDNDNNAPLRRPMIRKAALQPTENSTAIDSIVELLKKDLEPVLDLVDL